MLTAAVWILLSGDNHSALIYTLNNSSCMTKTQRVFEQALALTRKSEPQS